MPLDRVPKECPGCGKKIKRHLQDRSHIQFRYKIILVAFCLLATAGGFTLLGFGVRFIDIMAIMVLPTLAVVLLTITRPRIRVIRCHSCDWADSMLVGLRRGEAGTFSDNDLLKRDPPHSPAAPGQPADGKDDTHEAK